MIISSFGGKKLAIELVVGEPLAICCWGCGKKHFVFHADKDIAMKFKGLSVFNCIKHIGWTSRADFERKHVLIFCSDECAEKSQMDNGRYRYSKVS